MGQVIKKIVIAVSASIRKNFSEFYKTKSSIFRPISREKSRLFRKYLLFWLKLTLV